MPTKKTADPSTNVLHGPADTDDPAVRVSTTSPDNSDLRSGTKPAAVVVDPLAVPPLRLIGEPRIETYEQIAPDGTVVEVTHNLDTGEASYHWTDRRGTPLSTGA